MEQVIPTHIKDVWDTWNIRGLVILSLSIQTVLIIFAPLRKRTPNSFLVMVLWLSYLLADWSANFAIGLIAKNQGKGLKPEDPPQDQKLMALWAPFLLLHLGGPGNITAYSLEDNALWHRHFLGLALQAIAGAYVVIQSLPNTLWLIIMLLFIAGTLSISKGRLRCTSRARTSSGAQSSRCVVRILMKETAQSMLDKIDH